MRKNEDMGAPPPRRRHLDVVPRQLALRQWGRGSHGGVGLPIGAKLGPRGKPVPLRRVASYRSGPGCSPLQQSLPRGPWGVWVGGVAASALGTSVGRGRGAPGVPPLVPKTRPPRTEPLATRPTDPWLCKNLDWTETLTEQKP